MRLWSIGAFLREIFADSARRGYDFSEEGICTRKDTRKLTLTQGQDDPGTSFPGVRYVSEGEN